MTGPGWYTVQLITPAMHNCACQRPRPTRVRRPRKVYFLSHERPVFLKPSETEEYTAEELAEYRKTWAKP